VVVVKGGVRRQSQCHSNTAELWDLNKDRGFKIMTGWALSGDKQWRQHSWGVHKGKVIETTVKRKAYYGYVLNHRESEDFHYENY
jgi:hypothetical protein